MCGSSDGIDEDGAYKSAKRDYTRFEKPVSFGKFETFFNDVWR